MKALARYQVILLGEQRHISCEQLAQGCCPNSAAAGVEPATSRSRVKHLTATLPSHPGLSRHLYFLTSGHTDGDDSAVSDATLFILKLN